MADEVEAREQLIAMQERLGRGPHAALDVTTTATPHDVRAAFLVLTKRFHPAKFGRMPADVQRFANEVFLGLKAAHDALGGGQAAALSAPRVTSPGIAATGPTAAAAARAPGGFATTQRLPTSPGMPALQRPTSPGMQPLARGPRIDATKPLPSIAEPKPKKPDDPGAKTPPLELVARPRLGSEKFPVVKTPAPPKTGDTHPGITALPAVTRADQVGAPAIAGQPIGRMDPNTTMPPAPSVQVALDLLANKQWDAARVALSALTAMAPDSRHVRALVAYATGRQAQLEQRVDDARVELQRSLQLDPDLAPAKTALAELFARKR